MLARIESLFLTFQVLFGLRTAVHRAMLIGLLAVLVATSLAACGDGPSSERSAQPTQTSATIPTGTPTPVPTDTPTPVPTPTSVPTDTPTPVPTLTPTSVPTDTPTPTPTPVVTLASLYETRNTRWLVWAHPTVARQIQDLTWVADGLSDLERSAVDELIYMAVAEIANLEAVLTLAWVQDGISDTEYEALDRLGALDYRNTETLSAVLTLPWVQDGIGDADYEAVDALAVLDYRSPASTPLVLTKPWVQDGVSETEYDIIDWLGRLSYGAPEAAHQVLTMPFLDSPDTTDVLALRGMNELADQGALDALAEHPLFWDGVTEDDTILIAASGTLYSTPDEVRHVLELGPAAIETASLGTNLTPNLRISIIRTDNQPRPGTIEATRDLVEFVENTIGLPLPVDHVIIVLNEEAVTDKYAGTNYGFAFSYLPKYEQQQGTPEWRSIQRGFVHETAHYYWRGNEGWIDEGLANTVVYLFGRENGLSRGQQQPHREGCEAHDLAMLSEWNPESNDRERYHCNYYLGQLFFQELLESMDAGTFREKLRQLYQIYLEAQEADRTPGIAEVRQVFPDQAEIIDRHWSGKMNAPENRPFDEGRDRTNHALIQWTQPPTYDGSNSVSLEGVLLDDAVLVNDTPKRGGYQNFSLYTADGEWVGSILPGLTSGKWTLDDPGDTVAAKYLINPETRSFIIEFPFPQQLEGTPSDYVVYVWGFQDTSRTPIIGENLDLLGYARVRVPLPRN